jgi:hypothetical protein
MTLTQFLQKITTMLLLIAIAPHSQAQRYIDLAISYSSPTPNQQIAYGDTVFLNVKIQNNGPEDVLAIDTIVFTTENVIPSIILGDTILAGTFKVYEFAYYGSFNEEEMPKSITECIYIERGNFTETFLDTIITNDTNCVTFQLMPQTNSVAHINNQALQVTLYPNPAHNEVNITWDGGIKVHTLNLVNMMGQVVHTTAVAAQQQAANMLINSFPAGVYTLQLHTDKGIAARKLVIQ